MGQFVVAFSFVVFILQTTTILLQRPASTWSFWLVSAAPTNTALKNGLAMWQQTAGRAGNLSRNNTANISSQGDVLSLWWSNQTDQQIACIMSASSSPLPTHCILRAHTPQSISPVLKEWNPHALLMTLCCIQLLICISKTQHSRERKQEAGSIPRDRNLHVPLGYGLVLFAILIFIVLILTGLKNKSLVQYPTILCILALLAMCGWYVWQFEPNADDGPWNLAFHMQLVSVPVAVLSIATMGARLWTDVFTHAVLLSAAGNALWLQGGLVDAWAQQLCGVVTVFLPTLSLYLAHAQWGGYADNWKYAMGLMGCAGLLPLYVFSVALPAHHDDTHANKIRLRMAHLCTGGALLSMVVNMAMVNGS